MDTASIVAPAKVNLTLDITGRRDDGYHFMRMIMQSVSLHNVITINCVPGGEDVSILCSSAEVCTDESNTAYKAAMAFFQFLHQPVPGLEIVIENNIPFMAGLGCASADAAAVLVGLNHITGAGLSSQELCEIGVKVGADVPFCILGGTQLVEGIGEIFTPLPNLTECYIVIAKPDESVSTAEAFARYDRIGVERRPDTDGMIGSIVAGDIPGVGEKLLNVFEELDLPASIGEIRRLMMENDALGAAMSGSGSAVFGIFDLKGKAKRCVRTLEENGYTVHLTKPVHHGALIVEE